jgi:hypothetical protein
MTLPRVYADFNKMDDEGRLRLTCLGTQQDLDALGIELSEGLHLCFYTDDAQADGSSDALLVEGVVERDRSQGWVARIDRAAIRHDSDL